MARLKKPLWELPRVIFRHKYFHVEDTAGRAETRLLLAGQEHFHHRARPGSGPRAGLIEKAETGNRDALLSSLALTTALTGCHERKRTWQPAR